jgi:hypothetical protein
MTCCAENTERPLSNLIISIDNGKDNKNEFRQIILSVTNEGIKATYATENEGNGKSIITDPNTIDIQRINTLTINAIKSIDINAKNIDNKKISIHFIYNEVSVRYFGPVSKINEGILSEIKSLILTKLGNPEFP